MRQCTHSFGFIFMRCVIFLFFFILLLLHSFLVFFAVRLLHLSRFVWFAQKQIAGSMQMYDAAYQILFESLDLVLALILDWCIECGMWDVGCGWMRDLALICLAKGARHFRIVVNKSKATAISLRDTCSELNCQLQWVLHIPPPFTLCLQSAVIVVRQN